MSDLRTVLEKMDRRTPYSQNVLDVVALAREIKELEVEAWSNVSDWELKMNDTEAAHWRGTAHALCHVLGDQEALFRLIDSMEGL